MRSITPLVMIVLVGCGGKSFIPPPPSNDTDRAAAATFLKMIRDGQTGEAWESSSAEFKSFMGKSDFQKYVRQHPQLKRPVEPTDVTTTNDALPLAHCRFQTTGGKPSMITVTLGREVDRWAVAGIKVE